MNLKKWLMFPSKKEKYAYKVYAMLAAFEYRKKCIKLSNRRSRATVVAAIAASTRFNDKCINNEDKIKRHHT